MTGSRNGSAAATVAPAAETEILLRRVERERRARKQAEQLLEHKSQELYQANQRLQAHAAELERIVHERTRALEQALQVVQDALRAKGEFLAVVSHEIRTPMNAVLGMAQLLLMTELSQEQRQYAETIHSSGEILLALINDILELSKLESGKVSIGSKPVDLRAAVSEVVQILSAQAQQKSLSMRAEVSEDVPAFLRGDATRLKQIFLNLVGNAIKFTQRGSVRIEISMVEDGASVECRVKDTGIGIPPDRIGRLFEKFSQVDSSISRRYGGTGLGLAICKRLVEGMGGNIGVESKPYHGSTFTFRIPAIPSEAPSESSAVASAPLRARATLRILLVEDNAVNQMLAMSMLQKLGAQADLAGNGQEAVDKVRGGNYDLVLMDMQMPGMDGLTATHAIRAMPDIRQPQIVALTANAMDEDREACFQAGMNGFLTKPFQVSELQEKLDLAAEASAHDA